MPLKATLLLSGASLLKEEVSTSIEIQARPINLSRSGICLTLGVDADWVTISPKKKINLILEGGLEKKSLTGRVVHHDQGADSIQQRQVLGLEFIPPLDDLARFLVPHELQH